MHDDFQLALDLLDRKLVDPDQLATLRFEALRQQRPLADLLEKARVLGPEVLDEIDSAPRLDQIDLVGLDIEDCSQCTCSQQRAKRVINSLLVDAYASKMDICIVGDDDATRVFGCDESVEEVFTSDADDFGHAVKYLRCLLEGDEGEFSVAFSDSLHVEFWTEIDEKSREITIVLKTSDQLVMVELPDELLEELVRIELASRKTLGELITRAWRASGADVAACACTSSERACSASRTGVELSLPQDVIESASDAARKLGLPRDFLIVRSLVMARELLTCGSSQR